MTCVLASGSNLAPGYQPKSYSAPGVEPSVLSDLVARLAYTVPSFSSKWAAEQACLPLNIVDELCWQLKQDHLLEVLGQDGPFNYKYAATQRGREHAARLIEICGYFGPAPVSLEGGRVPTGRSARADVVLGYNYLAVTGYEC